MTWRAGFKAEKGLVTVHRKNTVAASIKMELQVINGWNKYPVFLNAFSFSIILNGQNAAPVKWSKSSAQNNMPVIPLRVVDATDGWQEHEAAVNKLRGSSASPNSGWLLRSYC